LIINAKNKSTFITHYYFCLVSKNTMAEFKLMVQALFISITEVVAEEYRNPCMETFALHVSGTGGGFKKFAQKQISARIAPPL